LCLLAGRVECGELRRSKVWIWRPSGLSEPSISQGKRVFYEQVTWCQLVSSLIRVLPSMLLSIFPFLFSSCRVLTAYAPEARSMKVVVTVPFTA
jgi:hypothetical protein